MKKRYRHEPKPTVATHFPSLSRGRDLNHNVHMFTQDIHLAVMPIGGRTEKQKDFTVSLDGEKSACEYAHNLIGEIGRYDRHDLNGTVCDAVEEVARHLAWQGCAVYEIITDESGTSHIHGFTSQRLLSLPGCFLQIIPRGDWELWEKKWVFIPATKVWYLEMPTVFGGRRWYRSVVRKLSRFEYLGPAFWRQDLERGEQSMNFDLQLYAKNAAVYYDRVTKAWGWNRRDWTQERSTEFFSFYKLVSFRWAQAVLREHIINEINRLFVRLKIGCQLRVNGLPTSGQIRKIKEELLDGKISFGAASDRVTL